MSVAKLPVAEIVRRLESVTGERDYLRKRLQELEDDLALLPSPFHAVFRAEYAADQDITVFRLRMEPLQPYMVPLRPDHQEVLRLGHQRAKERLLRRMRWRTYLAFARALRKQIDYAFLNLARMT